MIVHRKLEQGTEEWFNIRYGKIGGTRSKGLFVNSDTLLFELLAELTEYYFDEDDYISPAMQRGRDLEPLALEKLGEYTGVEFHPAGWIESVPFPLLGISPDGLSLCETVSAETKCLDGKAHIEIVLANEIPNKHIHQCLHYFTVNPKLERHFFCSFRPENLFKPLFVKELTRSSKINLGTKAKPVIKTVAEWVDLAQLEAFRLQNEINQKLELLKF